mmetsp:Transcript_27312/g.79166  ORF Transcript_27312/g.79166 Transcript_27312/m.79166 type:complete len:346 (-) Transcript_27312:162-1199(-)
MDTPSATGTSSAAGAPAARSTSEASSPHRVSRSTQRCSNTAINSKKKASQLLSGGRGKGSRGFSANSSTDRSKPSNSEHGTRKSPREDTGRAAMRHLSQRPAVTWCRELAWKMYFLSASHSNLISAPRYFSIRASTLDTLQPSKRSNNLANATATKLRSSVTRLILPVAPKLLEFALSSAKQNASSCAPPGLPRSGSHTVAGGASSVLRTGAGTAETADTASSLSCGAAADDTDDREASVTPRGRHPECRRRLSPAPSSAPRAFRTSRGRRRGSDLSGTSSPTTSPPTPSGDGTGHLDGLSSTTITGSGVDSGCDSVCASVATTLGAGALHGAGAPPPAPGIGPA